MKKKLLSMMLTAAMTIGLLTGCGQDATESQTSKAETGQSSQESQSAESSTATKDEKSEEPVVISWYMPKCDDDMAQEEEVENAVNELLAERVGAVIDLKLVDSGSFSEKLNTMISAGEEFDICFTCSWMNDFNTNAANGAFADISGMLEELAPDILAKQEDYVWDCVTRDGGIYAIPGQGSYSTSKSLVFKKDLVEKYDFDYSSVTEWQDLEPYFETLAENEPGVMPVYLYSKDLGISYVSDRYSSGCAKGLNFDEQEQKYVKTLEAEEFLERYRTVYDWYQAGYCDKDAATKTEFKEDCKSGKYAVMKDTGTYSADGEKSTSVYGFDCVEVYLGNTKVGGSVLGAMNAISVTSKHPEKALEVLNAVWADPFISNTLAYGIEGVNYTIDEERSSEIGSKSVVPQAGDEMTWALWNNWVGPLFDQWDSSWNRIESLKEMQENNAKAEAEGTMGFVFDASELQTEIANVTSAWGEILPVLNTGTMPDFEQYIENANKKLTEAGLDKILEEANRQLAEWKAGK